MSREKHRKKNKNVLSQYIITSIAFIAISLAVIIPTGIVLFPYASGLVHKIEANYAFSVDDVVVSSELTDIDGDSVKAGDYIASLECEKRGLSCPVYYGLNRASARQGAGYMIAGAPLNQKGVSKIGGYDEMYLSALRSVKRDDVIVVRTMNTLYKYKVKSTFYDDKKSSKNQDEGKNQLVIYSIFSVFSDDEGKCFYAVCDFIGEEALNNVE